MSQETLPKLCGETPPKRKLSRVGSSFSYRCLVFPNNVLIEKPVLFGVIQVKTPKNVFF